ncbi:hypothetical protein O9G_001960 [Rozella allomycis CSF55]|uniref:WD40 repeat-like protein n=1 Tax=Rozella allomycis (strain CSF55) TaxID=988480 RepID=A0A075AT99_ROZAC|nr:hypothetical protein O9G_001960 [Rozella allomycis CSF55]|eukprot:EPZ31950.1 hypothetical protein O9G_001960 [Rozella allomycis CSF55]
MSENYTGFVRLISFDNNFLIAICFDSSSLAKIFEIKDLEAGIRMIEAKCPHLFIALENKKVMHFEVEKETATLKSTWTVQKSVTSMYFIREKNILLASDKFGDVFTFQIGDSEGKLVMGQISMILDMVYDEQRNFIITSDRDERSMCMGFSLCRFVSALALEGDTLVSGGGDDYVTIWNMNSYEKTEVLVKKDGMSDDITVAKIILSENKAFLLLERSNLIVVIDIESHKVEYLEMPNILTSLSSVNNCIFSLSIDGVLYKINSSLTYEALSFKTEEFFEKIEITNDFDFSREFTLHNMRKSLNFGKKGKSKEDDQDEIEEENSNKKIKAN